jgi:hypothetical protein
VRNDETLIAKLYKNNYQVNRNSAKTIRRATINSIRQLRNDPAILNKKLETIIQDLINGNNKRFGREHWRVKMR